jgi:PncC family amidohydrolase
MSEHDSLEAHVGAALRRRGWTICAAESCTGGLILSRLTDIPGSSVYVVGGIVAYSNEAKKQFLGVPAALLDAHGAVSAQVAAAMAQGALAAFDSEIAVSVTGIAGPGGGSADKPVGLTYIAAAGRDGIVADGVIARRFLWEGDRVANKAASADAALRLVLEIIGEADV